MFCRKCGKEVDPDDMFCWNCGTAIPKPGNEQHQNAASQAAQQAVRQQSAQPQQCMTQQAVQPTVQPVPQPQQYTEPQPVQPTIQQEPQPVQPTIQQEPQMADPVPTPQMYGPQDAAQTPVRGMESAQYSNKVVDVSKETEEYD